MSRPIRRLVVAIALVAVITIGGTVGGFFDVMDLINRVAMEREDNEYGGTTTTKVTLETKEVSFTRAYQDEWTKPINGKKPYMLQEVLDGEGQVVQYLYYYLTDKSPGDTVAYYKKALSGYDVVTKEVDAFTYIAVSMEEYHLDISVDGREKMTEVVVTIDKNSK